MAVIDELPQIKISIRIAGSEVDCIEYDDPDPPRTPALEGDARHSISKTIESQESAEYSICYEIDNSLEWFKGNEGLALTASIDGKCVTSRVLRWTPLDGQVLRRRLGAIEAPSDKPGKVIEKRFKFSAITRVEGRLNHLDQDRHAAKHVGEIEVTVTRVEILGISGPASWAVAPLTELGEKALKGKNVSHGTEFSGGEEVAMRKTYRTRKIDGDKHLARMAFRYMSKSALQIAGIIPRDPSPSPERSTIEGMGLPEIMRLAQERLDEMQDVKRVKREASSDVDPRPPKVYKTDIDGTIDLTED